jgi:hypothetical protein
MNVNDGVYQYESFLEYYVFLTGMWYQCSGSNMQSSTLKVEVTGSSETLIFIHYDTHRHIPE